MKKLPVTLAMAASVVALTHAATSRADDTVSTTSTTTTTEQPATTTTTQPAPVQNVTVQPPPAQASTTTTTAAPYTASAPSDYAESTTEHRPNKTLLSTGVGLFVVGYGASVVAGAVSDRDADKNLFIPVVGPWMDLADRGCDNRDCGSREDINKAMIITSGVVQGAGVLLGLSSLIIPESTTTTTKRATAKPEVKKAEVKVLPVSFGAGAGVGAVGRF